MSQKVGIVTLIFFFLHSDLIQVPHGILHLGKRFPVGLFEFKGLYIYIDP